MKPIITPKIDRSIAFQVRKISGDIRKAKGKRKPAITISREFGCQGFPLANTISARLSSGKTEWSVLSSDMLKEISEKNEYNRELMESVNESYRSQLQQDLDVLISKKPSDYTRFKIIAQNLKIIGDKGNTIIVGSGGAVVAQNQENFFHVRVTGSLSFRVNRVAELFNITEVEAANLVEERNLLRRDFIYRFTNKDIADPSFYHLILRNDFFSVDEMADIVLHAMKARKML
ncbi:MAG: cytidylate kinase-like family protein [Rhodothermaceae bacterium]|nr:cytidylate kinase-like family protein [Rhodothermaceae bacterium]